MNKPKVAVCIAAFNEQENIANVIREVLSQDRTTFDLVHFRVVSDASTDRTVTIAQSVGRSEVTVIESPERSGKAHHLNAFFREVDADIYVFFDADVTFKSDQLLAKLIAPIVDGRGASLVGCNAQQLPARTFVEAAINVSCRAFDRIRTNFQGGNNAFGANGCGMVLARDFAKTVVINERSTANDQFLYFSAITSGRKFIHERSAVVWYRSPDNFRDHVKQNTRFMASGDIMSMYFDLKVVAAAYAVPASMRYRYFLAEFLRKPLHAAYIFLVNRYCGYLAKQKYRELNAKWYMATSTKRHISE